MLTDALPQWKRFTNGPVTTPGSRPIHRVLSSESAAKDDTVYNLVRSCVLSSLLLGMTLALTVAGLTNVSAKIPYFFWIPLSFGALGIAGSTYMNLRQRCRRH